MESDYRSPSAGLFQWVRTLRREFHRHPELSFAEFETSRRIRQYLDELGLNYRFPVATTGVVADLGNCSQFPILAFRADMDALPIEEATDSGRRSYRSRNPGVMHACGHDCHMAIMLGVAKELSTDADFQTRAAARFLFQPGEEDGAGAAVMLKENGLGEPLPRQILAGHVSPGLPVGHLGFTRGVAYAYTDSLEFTIEGRGGHASQPQECIDPVHAMGQVIVQLQSLVSRSIGALDAAVLSICQIEAGTRGNIIPDQVRMSGTLRTHHKDIRERMLLRLQEVLAGIDASFQTRSRFEITEHYPAGINDPQLTDFLVESARELFGSKRVHFVPPSLGGEDFAFFSSTIPGSMIRIGTDNPRRKRNAPCHSCHFDIDEKALDTAVHFFSGVARRWSRQL